MAPGSGPEEAIEWGTPAARGVLGATIGGSAMAMLDASAVNVALPAIAADLDATVGALQWTVNAYTLALAALILLAGSLADRFGRRRVHHRDAHQCRTCPLHPPADAGPEGTNSQLRRGPR